MSICIAIILDEQDLLPLELSYIKLWLLIIFVTYFLVVPFIYYKGTLEKFMGRTLDLHGSGALQKAIKDYIDVFDKNSEKKTVSDKRRILFNEVQVELALTKNFGSVGYVNDLIYDYFKKNHDRLPNNHDKDIPTFFHEDGVLDLRIKGKSSQTKDLFE